MTLCMWLVVAVSVIVRTYPPLMDDVYCKVTFTFKDLVSVSRFYDEFRSPLAMLFNWRKRPFYLQLLFSLSGDVHFNPGPVSPGIFLCGLCDEAVSDVDKAMCCDSCDKWIYIIMFCDHYMSEDKYDHLIQNPSLIRGSVQPVLKFIL